MTMLFIAIGITAVLFSPKFDSFNALSVDYLVRYMLECYVFCRLVSDFNETHYQIAHKLSKFQWGVKLRYSQQFAQQYKQVRSTVLIVMLQSQRSLKFSCGGLFELTMARYTSIVNKSYTLTMYFWNLKSLTQTDGTMGIPT
ncbi:uncharacterized protein LOC135713150 [Ochlerotatus camptorhynchus]|uniref:uncharacterized protein LOC135713150 n=1 Tax=Ochlerotatus camptorhynchus TaxID=644619 RepID=UPI0031E23FFB